MKQFILAFALLTGISVSAQNQKQKEHKAKSPEEQAEKMTVQMEKKLTLTPEQLDKVKAINLETATKLQEIKKSAEKNREAKKQVIDEQEKKLAEVFTPEQMEEYKKLKEARRLKMKEKRKKKGPEEK